jgi:hypothetical protein
MSMPKLPRDLTSYDLLKTLAVITMVADHMGYFFFPDDLWWRAVGRLSAPVWLFLIGYARSRDLSLRILIGWIIVLAVHVIAGRAFFPVNILFTIFLTRIVLDKTMAYGLSEPQRMIGMVAVFVLAALPTFFFWDYGTLAFVFAGFGYLVRLRAEGKAVSEKAIISFAAIGVLAHSVLAVIYMGIEGAQVSFVVVGCGLVFMILYHFRSIAYPKLSKTLPGFVTAALQFCGRRTLEIYVAHLVLFEIIALVYGFEGAALLQFKLFEF